MYSNQRYVNFYTDFAFKRLFGSVSHKDLLIGFLNALLYENEAQVQHEAISDIQYLNTERIGRTDKDRRAYFDVMCITDRGERFIVEMQRAEQAFPWV
ncbi:MAG: PD-(D/E)XK nuclease family transposase [Bacteroidales bacterium]|nr:PD-(D/E)XK nuclease family transposase [Bacteroidales bacterium]